MSAVHVYTARPQPATQFATVVDIREPCRRQAPTWRPYRVVTRRFVTRFAPNRLLPTWCCLRRRPAKNLVVRVYYDAVAAHCAPGKGCKAPKRRERRRR